MKKNLKILIIVGASLVAGCEKYLDINTDPTRINEQSVSLAALLPTCIEATSQANHQMAYNTGQITQYLALVSGGGVDAHNEPRVGDAWSTVYLTALTNLNLLVQKANDPNDLSPHYSV
jgi:hypothetical protein